MSEFKQCPNGHYYQGDECPYCKQQNATQKKEQSLFKQCPNGHYYTGGDCCPYCNTKRVISIGSASDNDYIINNQEVEAHHCKIEYIGNDKYCIVDLGTASGTFVNGKRVEGSSSLEPYDEVKVGKENVVSWMHNFPTVYKHPFRAVGFIEPPETVGDISSEKRTRKLLVGWLVTYSSDPMGEDFKIYEGRNVIGRDMDCNIAVNDNKVSSKHAVLLYRGGKYSITDSQSSWGTFVNGEDIDLEPRYLEDGDIITIGKTEFEFHSIGKKK